MNRIAPPGAKNIRARRAAQVLQMIDPAISRSAGQPVRSSLQIRISSSTPEVNKMHHRC